MKKTYWVILFVVLGFSCKRQQGKVEQSSESPDSIATRQEEQRLLSYWDDFDFRDTTLVSSPNFGEQKFVDFIAMLPAVSDSVAAIAIQSLLKKSEVEEVSFRYYVEKYRHYLYDPNSPMRNEAYYEPVLAYLVQSPKINAVERVRYNTLWKLVRQNQRGGLATNFTYLNAKGGYHTLYEGKADYKLLVFYDPTCSHCATILQVLAHSDATNTCIKKGLLEVVAVCAVNDMALWQDYQASIPVNWINGLDEKGEIIKKGLYNVPAFPTIYLLNKENKVLVKDAPLDVTLRYLLHQVEGVL